MMNDVFHHNSVADLLKRSPCQCFGKNIGIVQVSVDVYRPRGHYVPVTECPHLFLAAVDVFEFGLVGGTKAENPSCIVVHFQCEGRSFPLIFPLPHKIVP